jgi:hypothetical protein
MLGRLLWGPRLAAMPLFERLRRLGDECWSALQLVLFFVVAGVLFSPPQGVGNFNAEALPSREPGAGAPRPVIAESWAVAPAPAASELRSAPIAIPPSPTR